MSYNNSPVQKARLDTPYTKHSLRIPSTGGGGNHRNFETPPPERFQFNVSRSGQTPFAQLITRDPSCRLGAFFFFFLFIVSI